MPKIDISVESLLSNSPRVKQLSAMFDVPPSDRCRLEWRGELPIDDFDWNVGLIVGPSGCGKSTIAKQLFGGHVDLQWGSASVIDDFSESLSINDVAAACQSVGFNTVPAWMRPHAVLSTGEKFRVDLARRLLELSGTIVCDEFTSVVDRQVAKIGSHAVQKAVRRTGKKFVAVSCHYDVIDWLQPDWVFEPATMAFARRSLRRRPEIKYEIIRVGYEAWQMFSRFHYLTADLNRNAACYVLFASIDEDDWRPASFAGLMHRPHPKNQNIVGVSRNVTLPDWQGLGLAFVLCDSLGAAVSAVGRVLHHYPAHPSFIRSLDASDKWEMIQKPGNIAVKLTGNHARGAQATTQRRTSGQAGRQDQESIARRQKNNGGGMTRGKDEQAVARAKQGSDENMSQFAGRGNRPCAVFRYVGPKSEDAAEAYKFLNGE